MNLSKISMPVVSFISLISISTCAVAGTADVVKKQFLQQLKALSQTQQGKTLKKSTVKEVLLTDSIETYTWGDPSWEKDGTSRYSYDQSGRVTQIVSTGWDDSKTEYQYDADGKTVRELSISSSGVNVGGVDTVFSVMKFFPGCSNAVLSLYNGSSAELNITNLSVFSGLDSIITISYEHTTDGKNDTTVTATAKYEKVSNAILKEKMTMFIKDMMDSPTSYTYTFYSYGNGVIDTLKGVLVYENEGNGQEALSPDFILIISKRNQQGKILEQTTIDGLDSAFSDYIIEGKDSFSYNSSGSVDSVVTQEWDDETSGWVNAEKTVISYKKSTIGVKHDRVQMQSVNSIGIEWKLGNLQLTIPDGVVVSAVQQLDLQGKVISRTAVANAKNSIVLNTLSKNSSTVSLVRLKTSGGDFTCKVNSVR